MKKYHGLLRTAVALFFAAALVATAQPPCAMEKGEGMEGHMFEDLNLTGAQKDQLKSLHEEMQVVRQKHFEQIKQVREKIKAELLKPEPSQNTLYGYAGEIGALTTEMSKAHGDHLLKVKKILTADQFAKLVEKQDQMGFMQGGDRHGKKGACVCPHQGAMEKGKACPHATDAPAK